MESELVVKSFLFEKKKKDHISVILHNKIPTNQ